MLEQDGDVLGGVGCELDARVQRCVPVGVEKVTPRGLCAPVHLLTPLDQERQHRRLAARPARGVQRREPLQSLVHHRVCAVLHEAAHGGEVAERTGPVERCLTVRVEHVHLRLSAEGKVQGRFREGSGKVQGRYREGTGVEHVHLRLSAECPPSRVTARRDHKCTAISACLHREQESHAVLLANLGGEVQ